MNTLFTVIFIITTVALLFTSPDVFLATLLDGATKSATMCVSLLASYAVWMGLMKVWEDSGVAHSVSKLLKPFASKLLKTKDEKTLDAVCMNLSVNLLGISGAATAYGIKAANLLDKTENAEYSSAMFFVLNATSLQIFPASMIAVRVSMNSANPNDIILPTFIITLFSTLLGAVLTRLFVPPKKRKEKSAEHTDGAFKKVKTKGAGI